MTTEKEKQNKDKHFSWGTGLTIAIILFTCGTLGIVAFLTTLDYQMVSEDNYEKAVHYQEHIDRVDQTNTLDSPVEIELLRNTNEIQICFPAQLTQAGLSGTVQLYRPNDSSEDQEIKLVPDENGIQHIKIENLAKGKWEIKVNWTAGNKNYYEQKNIFI